MAEISFNDSKQEYLDAISPSKIMVLATCSGSKVTARSMSCIAIGEKIYFQTDTQFRKYKQITDNKNVALCFDNVQIEGIAKVKGHPMDKENIQFAQRYKEHYKSSFEAYSQIKNEVVIEVNPTLVTTWNYEGIRQYRKIVHFASSKAYKEYYESE